MPSSGAVGGERRVLVWRTDWLPGSETFVRAQMDSYVDWKAVSLGTQSISSALVRQGDEVAFTPTVSGRIQRKVHRVTGSSRRVRRLIARHSVDLIHAHFLDDAMLVVREAERLGIPLVITVHGRDVTARDSISKYPVRRLRKTLEYASRIIAVSQFTADAVMALGAPEDKVRIHRIGIGVPAQRHDSVEATVDVAFVGRLVEKKGILDLLTAISRAQELQGRSITSTVIGDGPMRSVAERLASDLGLAVSFLGAQPPAIVERALASSRVFVAPSMRAANGDSEGFGMVFLEAAAQNLPVVSYRHGGVPEAVDDGVTGLLVPEGDRDELAISIVDMLSNPDRARSMGRAGRRRVEEEFDVRTQTRVLEHIYDEVVTETRAQG